MVMNRWKYGAGAAALLVGFAVLAGTIRKTGPTAFDEAVGGWLTGLRSDGLTAFFKALSPLVSTTVFAILLVVFALLFAFVFKKRLEPLLLIVNLAVAFGLYRGLKGVFARPRPSADALIHASGFSFPSGNALMAASFYGLIAYLLYRLWKKSRPGLSWTMLVLGFALVLLIGVSRVYLGVHYATDILAGYALGGAWMLICAAIVNKRS
ncbi:phosphatase PAP2 family protein [Paenibacillus ginsengarvi]|uniref:Phosphatase PAP2 family protein n=2 Tax=Paenibacillus ginsengarvi TaxID=400777 RepID=A0A3B0BL69_9BACL|nr:phosphatase PAP2 family protein [Paenibacillus ginsengarvi]